MLREGRAAMEITWVMSRRQKIAACTVLMMAALCLFQKGREFEMPHMHAEAPIMPTTTVSMFASGNSTASLTSYNLTPF